MAQPTTALPDRAAASPQSRWIAPAVAALLVAGLAAYSGSFRGAFIFDDLQALDQPTARNLRPLWPIIAGARPVVQFTLALNHRIGALWAWHAFNLAIHLLAALALFGIVRRTLIKCRLPGSACAPLSIADCRMLMENEKSTTSAADQERMSFNSSVIPQHSAFGNRHSEIATLLAFCIALLWMLHPLQTESVTYIIQRMESLAGLFCLLTLYCFIRAADATADAETRRRGDAESGGTPFLRVPASQRLRVFLWQVAAVAACALGMGSKETAVSAPLLVLLYDRTFIAGSFREALRKRWGFYLALAATGLILARQVIAVFAPHADSAGFGLAAVTPLEYALSELGVIRHYLALALWPAGLCLDYGWPVARTAGEILPGALVVGPLLALTVLALARRPSTRTAGMPAWGFIGAWFFLLLAPSSSIMPIRDLAFEHRMYLPLAAVIAAAVLAAYLAARRLHAGLLAGPLRCGAAVALVLALAAALGSLTFLRNRLYRSGAAIWRDAAEKRPGNPRAWNYLGNACAAEGRPAEAISLYDHALSLRRDYPDAWYNRGSILLDLNRFDEAIRDFDTAIALQPDFAAAYHNRGIAYNHLRRMDSAIADYDRAIRIKPDFAMAFYNRALTYVSLGRYDKAVEDFSSAIKLDPRSADLYNRRALVYHQLGKYDLALRDMDRGIALDPDSAEAYNNRAVVNVHFERYDRALSDCAKAIALDSGYLDAYKNRAIIYYRLKEYPQALADLKTFEKLGGQPDPNFLRDLTEAAGKSGSRADPPRDSGRRLEEAPA